MKKFYLLILFVPFAFYSDGQTDSGLMNHQLLSELCPGELGSLVIDVSNPMELVEGVFADSIISTSTDALTGKQSLEKQVLTYSNGLLKEMTIYCFDDEEKKWVGFWKYVKAYNETGQIISELASRFAQSVSLWLPYKKQVWEYSPERELVLKTDFLYDVDQDHWVATQKQETVVGKEAGLVSMSSYWEAESQIWENSHKVCRKTNTDQQPFEVSFAWDYSANKWYPLQKTISHFFPEKSTKENTYLKWNVPLQVWENKQKVSLRYVDGRRESLVLHWHPFLNGWRPYSKSLCQLLKEEEKVIFESFVFDESVSDWVGQLKYELELEESKVVQRIAFYWDEEWLVDWKLSVDGLNRHKDIRQVYSVYDGEVDKWEDVWKQQLNLRKGGALWFHSYAEKQSSGAFAVSSQKEIFVSQSFVAGLKRK